MSERDEIQARRREAKKAFATLYDEVSGLLFRHDPIGINFGDNTDEYEPEVDTILPRLRTARGAADVCTIVHEEFVHWFGADTAGPIHGYQGVANEIWEVYRRFQQRRSS